MATKAQGKKAWLVTWESSGEHARKENRIAAVFRPQLSGEHVRELVGCIHAFSEYTPRKRMACALDPKANPYPAQFGSIGGVYWQCEIICGHNPCLRARLVDDLMIDSNNQGTWKERPQPIPQS